MRVRVLILGLFYSRTSGSAVNELYESDLDDTWVDVVKTTQTSKIPLPVSKIEPVSQFRSWLRFLLHRFLGIAPAAQLIQEPPSPEWILVSMDKQSQVFQDLLSTEATGDWSSEDFAPVTSDRFSPMSLPESDPYTDFVLGTAETDVEKWAFDYTQSSTERAIDREYVWKQAIAAYEETKNEGFTVVENESSSILSSKSPVRISSDLRDEIKRDVVRTRPESIQPQLQRMLEQYATGNPTVGFCQGMSYMASIIVQQQSQEFRFAHSTSAFSMLVDHINVDYYLDDLSGFRKDIRRLQYFLAKTVGKTRFKYPLDFSPDLIMLGMTDVIMTAYSRIFPEQAAVRILDIGFTLGRAGLFSVYMASLELAADSMHEAIAELGEFDRIIEGPSVLKSAIHRMGQSEESFKKLISTAEWYFFTYKDQLEVLLEEKVDLMAREEDWGEVEVVEPVITAPRETTTTTQRPYISVLLNKSPSPKNIPMPSFDDDPGSIGKMLAKKFSTKKTNVKNKLKAIKLPSSGKKSPIFDDDWVEPQAQIINRGETVVRRTPLRGTQPEVDPYRIVYPMVRDLDVYDAGVVPFLLPGFLSSGLEILGSALNEFDKVFNNDHDDEDSYEKNRDV